MALLVFEHGASTGALRLGETLRDYGHPLRVVALHRGEPVPRSTDPNDAGVVLNTIINGGGSGSVVKSKVMLWFVKDKRGDVRTWVESMSEAARAKAHHDHEQPIAEATYLIDRLTEPGDLVFDPFCGSGTTCVAAKQLGRRWLGCDIDEDAVAIARQRISAKALVAPQG